VSHYWPEYAAEGKEAVRIAQLLSHQAGVPDFVLPTTLRELLPMDVSAARLVAQKPFWLPGTACSYHGVTTGPIASAIFHRSEVSTSRQFVAGEIAIPFSLDVSIGLNPEDFEQAVQVATPEDDIELSGLFGVGSSVSADNPRNPNLSPIQSATLNPPVDGTHANFLEWRAADLPSANGFGNARSLAQLYALLLGHTRNDKHLSRPVWIEDATGVRTEGMDQVKNVYVRWATGFAVNEGLYGLNHDTFSCSTGRKPFVWRSGRGHIRLLHAQPYRRPLRTRTSSPKLDHRSLQMPRFFDMGEMISGRSAFCCRLSC
jgi:CubicO group peptidase (beta-lactamase class C family)